MADTKLPQDSNGRPILALLPGTHQSIAYTAAAGTIANATGAGCRVIRVVATTACYIKVSAAATAATTSDVYLPANVPEYLSIEVPVKVSAIRVTGDGTLHVTEMN